MAKQKGAAKCGKNKKSCDLYKNAGRLERNKKLKIAAAKKREEKNKGKKARHDAKHPELVKAREAKRPWAVAADSSDAAELLR